MKLHRSLQFVYGISEFKTRDCLLNDFAKLQDLTMVRIFLSTSEHR